MRFRTLSVRNFGVFHGRADFALDGSGIPGNWGRITTVSGQNGVGKTTLFRGAALALFGPLALGTRVSQQDYREEIAGLLHRGPKTTAADAEVRLSLEFFEGGRPTIIEISRMWKRVGAKVEERLSIRRNGSAPDVRDDEHEAWLRSYVPPGLQEVLFFDAERLDLLTDPVRHGATLRGALGRLFGFDTTAQLRADLELFLVRRGGSGRSAELAKAATKLRDELEDMAGELARLEADAAALAQREVELAAGLHDAEQALVAAGGSYASRRQKVIEDLEATDASLATMSEELRELCGGLLPFALAPGVCQSLRAALVRERTTSRARARAETFQVQIDAVLRALASKELWEGVRVSGTTKGTLVRRLTAELERHGATEDVPATPIVHNLSEPEGDKVLGHIDQALGSAASEGDRLAREVRRLREQRRELEDELHRVPDESTLAPLVAAVEVSTAEIAAVRTQRASLHETIGVLKFRHEHKSRTHQDAVQALAKAQSTEQQAHLAHGALETLRSYETILARETLERLQAATTEAFNLLCHKDRLIHSVEIEPATFRPILRTSSDHVVSFGDLSAGERQLYALASLLALRKVAGADLPILIDTPLARLDNEHRLRVLNRFLPSLDGQIILFATDAELEVIVGEAPPGFEESVFRLRFDHRERSSSVATTQAKIPAGTQVRQPKRATHGYQQNSRQR